MDTLPALTSHRILDDTMSILQTHIPLQATGYRCQRADLWRVLVAATAGDPLGDHSMCQEA
jgi:hypothetical protein